MWLNRRVPVGTHGGVRGRLFRVERASYSIIYNHPSTFPIVCMWDKPAFSFLIKTVLISLQSNPEKNSHRLLVANLWLVKHPFFVYDRIPLSASGRPAADFLYSTHVAFPPMNGIAPYRPCRYPLAMFSPFRGEKSVKA